MSNWYNLLQAIRNEPIKFNDPPSKCSIEILQYKCATLTINVRPGATDNASSNAAELKKLMPIKKMQRR
jgi:hypothetical protein